MSILRKGHVALSNLRVKGPVEFKGQGPAGEGDAQFRSSFNMGHLSFSHTGGGGGKHVSVLPCPCSLYLVCFGPANFPFCSPPFPGGLICNQ